MWVGRLFNGFANLCLLSAAAYIVVTSVYSLVSRGDFSQFLDHWLTVDHYLKGLGPGHAQ